MHFTIVSAIADVTVIATGRGVRSRQRLNRKYGVARWRKMKGTATVELENGSIRWAEIHWYEAHGVGRRDFKIKRFLD